MVEGLAFKRGNKEIWLNLDHMAARGNIDRRVKERRLAVLGRWGRLIRGVVGPRQKGKNEGAGALDPIGRWRLLVTRSR